ncbi:MAG: phytoene desaturase family protein [Imperialibacter sp.]|uniref:phytoene desaturase family protein n=1 Tax=Imperialibacter sp. TaxID=2038411 RepID=UPI0032F089EB
MPALDICVIGSGFAGLSAATCLADQGHNVTLLEKNKTIGGRARKLEADGFMFDMGPSWYWMPDVFDRYFALFGKKPSDYYHLKRLDPSYTVVFDKDDHMKVPAKMSELEALFESLEKGAGKKLQAFLSQAEYKYEVGINDLVYKPSRSLFEFIDPRLLKGLVKMDVFQSMHSHVRKFFTNDKLIRLMEFPVLFLGAIPENTPALYSLMNYADMSLGTWYPEGGMYKVIEAMVSLAEEKGVKILTDHEVEKIVAKNGKAESVLTAKGAFKADVVVAGADYHHVDQHLLDYEHRNYSPKYWEKRTMAPSSLLFYIGLNKKLENITHHMLFFDEDFGPHAKEIYETPDWPSNPLFYLSATSVTDNTVAPKGCENLILLIPVAPGLKDDEATREKYYNIIMDRLEILIGQEVKNHVIFKQSYAHNDFIKDYHAFRGNAYGLANTLKQTAILKPSLKNRHLKNVYYTGQLTVPGPGVPPTLISGQVVANEIKKDFVR